MAAQPTDELDDLDGERPSEPFTVQVGDRTVVFRPAAGPGWQDLMDALTWPATFIDLFGPDDPADVAAVEALPVWQMRMLLRGWRVHHGLCVERRDNLRLVALLSRPAYRSAAEQDLWEIHHLDLTAEWQARRWRRLLNLLEGLRRTSHINEAMAQDDELAELYMQRHDGTEETKTQRRVSEFSVEAELLSNAVDRLGDLLQAHAAGKGVRPRRIPPMPRPETAIHRLREKRSHTKHKYTVARVFGLIDAKGQPTGRGPVPDV